MNIFYHLLLQIEQHYSLNSVSPELNLEKLQIIATSKASPDSKIRWLGFFNSSAATREAQKIPAKHVNEDKLTTWIAKACFWTDLSDQTSATFEEIMRQDRIPIDMTVSSDPLNLVAYLEDCRMKLWENAFSSYFSGNDSFKKQDDFQTFKGCELVVRRVLFRYFKYELLAKQAIAKENLPIF